MLMLRDYMGWKVLFHLQHTGGLKIRRDPRYLRQGVLPEEGPIALSSLGYSILRKSLGTTARSPAVESGAWLRYTDLPNPCEGIKGYSLEKRTMYITGKVLLAEVYAHASESLRDAMDLAYLTGQRPADTLRMTARDVIDGHLSISQEKTKQPLRIVIHGTLAELLERIATRKETHNILTAALLTNTHGKRLTAAVLRNHFDEARTKAAKAMPQLAQAIRAFWFYDLREKAADDTSDGRGDQAASDLLRHDSVKTTQRHYLRRGKIVTPTK